MWAINTHPVNLETPPVEYVALVWIVEAWRLQMIYDDCAWVPWVPSQTVDGAWVFGVVTLAMRVRTLAQAQPERAQARTAVRPAAEFPQYAAQASRSQNP